jgi:hypothetical protein
MAIRQPLSDTTILEKKGNNIEEIFNYVHKAPSGH